MNTSNGLLTSTPSAIVAKTNEIDFCDEFGGSSIGIAKHKDGTQISETLLFCQLFVVIHDPKNVEF